MLRLEEVSKDLGDFALKEVNLRVNRGEYFVLLGPSGAGKTLLLEVVAGIHKPDRGRIYLEGEDVTEKPPERRGIAYVPQNYALFPHLNVYENIAYGLRIRKVDRREIDSVVRFLADSLGISHLLHRKPSTLSGGEQQRVAIARALAVKPKILLLDEPFSNLDLNTKLKLIEDIRRWHDEFEFTAIHVTHSFDEAVSLANRVGVMVNGRVEQVGSVFEVFSNPKSVEVARFLGYNVFRCVEVESLGLNYDRGEYVVIRPEDVLISDGGLDATVEYVDFMKFSANLTLNVDGIRLKALATINDVLRWNVRVGSKVKVRIKRYRVIS